MSLLPFTSSPINSRTDARWVNVTGDTMTGTLDMGTNAIILRSSDGSRWALTVGNDGALHTDLLLSNPGESMGLFPLTITYG